MNEDELQLRDDIWRIVDELREALSVAGFVDVTATSERDGVTFYDERSSHTISIYPDFE